MAIIVTTDEGFVLDHERAVNDPLTCVLDKSSGNCKLKLRFRDVFFDILTPFMKDLQAKKIAGELETAGQSWDVEENLRKKSKRLRVSESEAETSSKVGSDKQEWLNLLSNFSERHGDQTFGIETATQHLVKCARESGHFLTQLSPENIRANNRRARESVNSFYKEFSTSIQGNFNNSNNEPETILVSLEGEKYLVPAKSTYYCNDIRNLKILEEKFDCIVMDPPWWNKYIRRRKAKQLEAGYQMLYDDDLLNMPIEDLAAEGALIVVWCTNSPSHLSAVQEKLFPKWKVQYVSRWYWVKVTKAGVPVCPFQNNSGKKPYEQILFGRCTTEGKCGLKSPEDGKVIVSVPSSIHSHKPPLKDVLKDYLKENANCLELFARSLISGWTSWGNEVLKLQHLSLYQEYA